MPCNSGYGSNVVCDRIKRRRPAEVGMAHEQFEALIEISSIHSHKIIPALYDHLVRGVSRKEACQQHGVNAGYLSICIKRLARVERIVSDLVRFY
ncbi:TPA: transcriptional regulator [Escherichia coli]|nr:transcriptional regulator [Escherichia coli]